MKGIPKGSFFGPWSHYFLYIEREKKKGNLHDYTWLVAFFFSKFMPALTDLSEQSKYVILAAVTYEYFFFIAFCFVIIEKLLCWALHKTVLSGRVWACFLLFCPSCMSPFFVFPEPHIEPARTVSHWHYRTPLCRRLDGGTVGRTIWTLHPIKVSFATQM